MAALSGVRFVGDNEITSDNERETRAGQRGRMLSIESLAGKTLSRSNLQEKSRERRP